MKLPTHIDGWLYVGVAVCTALTASLGSDEAVKYFAPENLFRLKVIVGAVGAGMLAGKMYRSTSFASEKAAIEPAPTVEPPKPVSTTNNNQPQITP